MPMTKSAAERRFELEKMNLERAAERFGAVQHSLPFTDASETPDHHGRRALLHACDDVEVGSLRMMLSVLEINFV